MMSVQDPVLSQYEWLVVVGALASWFFGFGTGSNDVANAFGTSVGAKTLTLRQAVVIAAIFEFTGAMVLGRVSTSTIAGGIANINTFQREPEVFAYGMVCALSISGIWQVVASYLELNVSSTHSIIGSIIGFSLVYGGKDAVNWQTEDKKSFPPYKGVVPIVVSWFFSPIFTGIAAALLFFLIRTAVLRRKNSYHLSFWLLPVFVLLTVFICIYFVFTKGAAKTLAEDDSSWTDGKSAWISAVIAAGMGVLVAAVLLPILKHRADKKFNEDGTLTEAAIAKDAEAQQALEKQQELVLVDDPHMPKWKKMLINSWRELKFLALHGTSVDIHEVVEEDELIHSIHQHAEVFDPKAEYAFQYLQVFSAICVVFAHGAGEVGYMAGPLATVWQVYTEGNVTKNVTAPAWVVFIGAFGLVVGLATYGYNVCRAMGVRLAKLTPTRGFCAELATALVIMIAAQYGLPTSSSQCITGGIIGVGAMEGKLGVNWLFFARQFSSWIATMFVAGIGTAALFSQGVYAPSVISGAQQVGYENTVAATTNTMIASYQAALFNYSEPANASLIPRLTTAQINAWNSTLASVTKSVNAVTSGSVGSVSYQAMMNYLFQALSLYQYDTVLSVGQLNVYPGSNACSGNTTAQVQSNTPVPCLAPTLLPPGVSQSWPPASSRKA